jgi:putative spermidine/putrescine transport system permease protein
MFLILPTGFLFIGSFQDADGNFTLANIVNLFEPSIISATG